MEVVNDDEPVVDVPYPSKYFPGRMVTTNKEENDEWKKREEEKCKKWGTFYVPLPQAPAPQLTWNIQSRKLLDKYRGKPIHQLMALTKLSRMMGIWAQVIEESGYYQGDIPAKRSAEHLKNHHEAKRRFADEKKQERENRKMKRKNQK